MMTSHPAGGLNAIATVKRHVSSLRDRVQALVLAYENGLVVAGDAR
jgi:hypothetical protein